MAAGLLLPGLCAALFVVPNGSAPVNKRRAEKNSIPRGAFLSQAKPFLLILGASISWGMAVGMFGGLLFIYVDAYLSLGELFAKLSFWGIAWGVVATPVWFGLSLRLGKPRALLLGMVLLSIVYLGMGFLPPGLSSFNLLLALYMLMTFASVSMGVVLGPMLCDVIDYDRLKYGVERNALYVSVHALLGKFPWALGSALGLAITGWFGFDVTAVEHSEASLSGLRLGVSWGPVFFTLLATLFVAKMPLDERRVAIIRRRLALRDR